MIIYTFSPALGAGEDRWKDTGIREQFYADLEEVRHAVCDFRDDLALQKGEPPVGSIQIERVKLDAPTAENVLTLLNCGIGPLVRHCEIVETIA